MKLRLIVVAAALGAGCTGTIDAPTASQPSALKAKRPESRMSPMGRLAAQRVRALANNKPKLFKATTNCGGTDPDCGDEDNPFVDPDAVVSLGAGQAETSIAVDASGQHIVIGYNDVRGFSLNPISLSGVIYSDDGGRTFADGGQLPSPGDVNLGGQLFPEVFGDPTVKWVSGCTFVYGSILMTASADGASAQTMGVHRSTDCGHTWQGPFEVTAATHPSSPGDAADKEFLDVDPETKRVLISWTNFSDAGPQMRTAYSDDILAALPTWSPGAVVSATEFDGQGSMPAFARRTSNAYVAWARFHAEGNAIGFARSSDNGATWSDPIELGSPFFFIDQILGNDRVHQFPSVAVDNSRGRHHGNVYVVHTTNDNHDGADIAFHRSIDGGRTFEPTVILNSRPGHDRAQWFPSVSVDDTLGRVYVMYYDQGVASSGDLTQTSYTFSDDGGVTWTRPRALTDRPFHAAWGNDTGQPNIGDYIQGAARNGDLYSAYAVTHPVGFTDGQPTSGSFTVPDVEGKHTDVAARLGSSATLQAGDATFTESGRDGNIDPGDVVTVQIPVTNYVTNPINATTIRDVAAWADSSAANVVVLPPFKVISSLAPGATGTLPVTLFIGKSFVAGTPIDIALHVVQGAPLGFGTLHVTVDTGTRVSRPLFAENFDAVAAGALPTGWNAVHAGGANTVPWTTSSSFCGTKSNGAFHVNANDGPVAADGTPGDPTRWERLISPAIAVPADTGDVTLEFDVCYDSEDDPSFNVLAYDGFFLRIFDGTPGHVSRSVLVDAFQSQFKTGSLQGYPKHFPRNSSRAYFEDMSAWAGDSAGLKHVKLRLPGMAGTTVQLRWEYAQDGGGICSDVRPGHNCGVLVDNIVMRSEKLATP
ncbi:MAG: glycosyl hydrolase, repeat-containing protein [Myxococcales bacterium]|nr:glycosyl hydrolase, repeat-containing protein [Myxococcales bacterium]